MNYLKGRRHSLLLNILNNRLPSPMRLWWKFLAIVTVFLYMGIAAHECIWTYINERQHHYFRNYFYAISNGFHGSYHDFVTSYYYGDLLDAAKITAMLVIALIVVMALIRILLYAIDKIVCTPIAKLYLK